MQNLGRWRLEAATGALFSVLLVIGVIVAVTPPPAVGASTADIAAFYSLRGPALHVVDLCFVLAAASLLWFIAPITTMIGRLNEPSYPPLMRFSVVPAQGRSDPRDVLFGHQRLTIITTMCLVSVLRPADFCPVRFTKGC